jgi:hypothetical protein
MKIAFSLHLHHAPSTSVRSLGTIHKMHVQAKKKKSKLGIENL